MRFSMANSNKDANHLQRLKQVLENELSRLDAEIEQKKLEIKEYQELQKLLEEMPRELTRDVLVPLSPVAFLPGKITQTNRTMVLLGDNYFVDKSCFQACEMIQRRIKYIQELIDQREKGKEITRKQIEFSDKVFPEAESGRFEIHEPCNETHGKKKGVRKGCTAEERKVIPKTRNISIQDNGDKSKSQLLSERNDNVKHEAANRSVLQTFNDKSDVAKNEEHDLNAFKKIPPHNMDVSDADDELAFKQPKSINEKDYAKLLSRLDELEKEEEDNGEMLSEESYASEHSSLDSDDFPDPDSGEEDNRSFEDIKNHVLSRLNTEKAEAKKSKTKSVRFKESPECGSSSSRIEELHEEEKEVKMNTTNEPKTITTEEPEYSELKRRSILRNSQEKSPVDPEAVGAVEKNDGRKIVPMSEKSFTGRIVEHDNISLQERKETEVVPRNEQTGEDRPLRRVSLFKKSRMSSQY